MDSSTILMKIPVVHLTSSTIQIPGIHS